MFRIIKNLEYQGYFVALTKEDHLQVSHRNISLVSKLMNRLTAFHEFIYQ